MLILALSCVLASSHRTRPWALHAGQERIYHRCCSRATAARRFRVRRRLSHVGSSTRYVRHRHTRQHSVVFCRHFACGFVDTRAIGFSDSCMPSSVENFESQRLSAQRIHCSGTAVRLSAESSATVHRAYVCICMRMNMCVHVCVYRCMCICMYMYICMCVYVCIKIYIHARMAVHMHS